MPLQQRLITSAPRAEVSEVSMDGSGSGTFRQLYRSDALALEDGAFTYSVDADGSMSFQIEEKKTLHGIVSHDGETFILGQTDGDIGLVVGTAKSSGMSNASLRSDYIIGMYNNEVTAYDPWGELTRVQFDGAGNRTYNQLVRSDGGTLESGTFTYTVASNGEVTINTGREAVHCVLSSDGTMLSCAQTQAKVGIDVAVKRTHNPFPGMFLLLD